MKSFEMFFEKLRRNHVASEHIGITKVTVMGLKVTIEIPNCYVRYVYKSFEFNNFREIQELMKKLFKVKELINFGYPIVVDFDDYSNPNSNIVYMFNNEKINEDFLEQIYHKHMELKEALGEELSKDDLISQIGYKGEKVIDPKYIVDKKSYREEEEAYKTLLNMFYNLTEEEQEAILIYKGCLFECINQMSAIDGFENIESEKLYDMLIVNQKFSDTVSVFLKSMRWEKIVEKVYNNEQLLSSYSAMEQAEIKSLYDKFQQKIYKILGKVDISTKKSFMESLKKIYNTIKSAEGKLVLPFDLTVYRGIGLDDEKTNGEVARGSIISTTMDFFKAYKYTSGKTKKIFHLKLKKGTPFLISPYTIGASDIDYRLRRVVYNLNSEVDFDTKEVILFEDGLFKENTSSFMVERNGFLYEHIMIDCSPLGYETNIESDNKKKK